MSLILFQLFSSCWQFFRGLVVGARVRAARQLQVRLTIRRPSGHSLVVILAGVAAVEAEAREAREGVQVRAPEAAAQPQAVRTWRRCFLWPTVLQRREAL